MKRKAEKVPCPVCGKLYYRSGLVGHMRFKHGRDYRAPMLPVKKPLGIAQARQKAVEMEDIIDEVFGHYPAEAAKVRVPCPICGKSIRKWLLEGHMNYSHYLH